MYHQIIALLRYATTQEEYEKMQEKATFVP